MNLEQLEYIIEVAKQGTISKAAEKLHVSHSAISQSLSSLESELELIIFKRSRSGAELTEDGQKILKLAYDVVNKIKEIKELGHNLSMMKGSLKITASSIFFTTLLPEVLYSFKQSFPNVKIIISEDDINNIEKLVKTNEIDIGLTYIRTKSLERIDPSLTYHVLYKTKFKICVSKNSPLAHYKKLTPRDVVQYPLALRNEQPGENYWERLLSNFGKPNIFLYSNNNDVIKNVIMNNLAIGIYTEFWTRQEPLIQSGEIIAIPFELNTDSTLSLISLQSKNKHISIIENEFLKYLKDRFDNFSSVQKINATEH